MSSSSTEYNPRSALEYKIPPFDEKNFAIWKAKALIVLETMDYGMLDIVNKGPHVPMYQPMKDGVADGPKKPTEKHQFSEEDRRLVMLDVRARDAIGNSLPYNIYHLV